MTLVKDSNGKFTTKDGVTKEEEATGELRTVFKNGKLINETTLQEIRDRASIG